MDAIDLLEKPWQRGVSVIEIAPKGEEFTDITEFVELFAVKRLWERAGQWDSRLSFWFESSNHNTTKQLFVHNGQMVVEFQYRYYPGGKNAPYCVGKMVLPNYPGPDIFVRGSHLRFRLSGNPVLGNLQ